MPAMLAARLSRIVPLLAILAVIAIAIYVFVSWRSTPARAKEVLIKVFFVLNAGLSAFFLLAALYALLDGNVFIAEFFFTFLATTLVLLGITWLCRRAFLKHNPNYRWRITDKAETKKHGER
ncbi:MAG: hypothetical protein Q4B69_06700 [Slackia sp.]|nr:hypothetical protein [Slackia sp.]